MAAYEYQVVQIQEGRVSWVNGEWIGSLSLEAEVSESEKLKSCPFDWTYLEQVGKEGWELISVVPYHIRHGQEYDLVHSRLFLKRQKRQTFQRLW